MSRSIHTTRSAFRRLARSRFGDPAVAERALEEARLELRRKRRIKQAVREERRRGERDHAPAPGGALPVDTISVEVADVSERLFHALDEADVRALFRQLPDAAEGIRRVRLSSGVPYIESMAGVADIWIRDPFTGRFGAEMVPGVFSPAVFGLYRPSDLSIHVHAYVLDRERFALPQRACELLLRLRALACLMHEVGHHQDLRQRTSRGRWLDDEEKLERHVERRENEWTAELVVPHLERRRPEDVRELVDWLAERGGARFSLAELVPRDGALDHCGFEAVRVWLGELAEQPDRRAERYSLADWLHLNDQYDLCTRVLDALSNEFPDDAEVLTLRADTLIHQERPREALAIADALRVRGVESDALWQVLCDSLECLGEWTRLLAACDAWCVERDRRGEPRSVVYDHRAVAFAALGDFDAMERWVREWARARGRGTPAGLRGAVVRRLERTARLRGGT